MVYYKSKEEIAIMREGGKRLAQALQEVKKRVKPGISAADLDACAEEEIRKRDGKPIFKGFEGFPASLCVSINQEVVHGIPTKEKILASGDIVGLDIGLEFEGWCTDMAVTVGVGKISAFAKKLLKITETGLRKGIEQARIGNTLGDIGAAVEACARPAGLGVVRDLCGHGIGKHLHEAPYVLNFGTAGTGEVLKEGLVIAIEPMFTEGTHKVKTLRDHWTIETQDGGLAAQFEKTIAITKNGPLILTEL